MLIRFKFIDIDTVALDSDVSRIIDSKKLKFFDGDEISDVRSKDMFIAKGFCINFVDTEEYLIAKIKYPFLKEYED